MVDSRLPPGAYTRKEIFGGTPNIALPYAVPALVGASLGGGVTVQCEAVTKGAVNGADVLANASEGSGLLRDVLRVADTCDATANYYEGEHYQVVNDTIDWGLNAQLSVPEMDTVTSDSAGSLASGCYYYVVTAIDQTGVNETNWTAGMSFASGCLEEDGTLDLSWECIPNATGYNVYRTDSLDVNDYPDFSGTGGLLATVVGNCSYSDDGASTVASGDIPPAVNETNDEPASGTTYYVDYKYSQFEFDVPRRFTSLTDVINTYGFGSQLAVMAEFAMSTIPGRGNEAPAVWCCAAGASGDPTAEPGLADFQEALEALEQIEGEQLLVVVGKTSATMRQLTKQHCVDMSDLEHKKERIAILYPPNNTAVGSASESDTIIGMANTLSSKRAVLVAPDSGAAKGYVQDAGETTRTETTLNPEYVAAAVAGRIAALPDTATPLTRKQIVGLTDWTGSINRIYNRTELIQLSEGGVLVPQYKDTSLWSVYKGVTTQTAIQDDAELSVVMQVDTLAMSWREVIDPSTGSAEASLIGAKLTPALLDAVEMRTTAVLNNLVGAGIINGYDANSINAEQNEDTLTQVDVSFNFEPIFPVNTVILTFSTSFSISG